MLKRFLSAGVIIFSLFWIINVVEGNSDYSGLPPGPYCARYNYGRCCPGRQDDCSAPILKTTCYCDDFCNRTREADCCPDYWSHCKGISLPDLEGPEPIRGKLSTFIFNNLFPLINIIFITQIIISQY